MQIFKNQNALFFRKLHVYKHSLDDVMATCHLRHCEILQCKVSSQEVQYENIIVICSKNPTNAMCKKYLNRFKFVKVIQD